MDGVLFTLLMYVISADARKENETEREGEMAELCCLCKFHSFSFTVLPSFPVCLH